MERITRWWRDRQQARVSTDRLNHSRSGLRFIVAFVGFILLIALVWILLLGGRWIYRHTFNSPSKASTTQSTKQESKTSQDVRSTDKNDDKNNTKQDAPSTPTPSPVAPTPTPAPSTVSPPQTVPRTGPEE